MAADAEERDRGRAEVAALEVIEAIEPCAAQPAEEGEAAAVEHLLAAVSTSASGRDTVGTWPGGAAMSS